MTLAEIENRFHFQYPPLYKQLEADGMLQVGEYGPDWYTTVFPKIKDNPTLFLHTFDFELLSVKAVKDAIEELAHPEGYRQIKPGFQFIPFGQNGAGDYYCFFPTEQDGDDLPIVFVAHDTGEAVYLAKNLQQYIFRVLLTDMSEQDTYNKVSDADFKANLQSVLKTHGKYLPASQLSILEEILWSEIQDYEITMPKGWKEPHRGLLTDVELKEIMLETIPYSKMDTTFEYAEG
jgi:hypothetical protein